MPSLRRCLPLLLVLSLGPAVRGESPAGGWLQLAGSSSGLNLADPRVEALLGEGFRDRVGDEIWTERRLGVLLVATRPASAIRLEARPRLDGTRVEARLDGTALGVDLADDGLLEWRVPGGVAAGPHQLTLIATPPPGTPRLPPKRVLALGRLTLDGDVPGTVLGTRAPPFALGRGEVAIRRFEIGLAPRLNLTSTPALGDDAVMLVSELGRHAPRSGRHAWVNDRPRAGFVVLTADSDVAVASASLRPSPQGLAARRASGALALELGALVVVGLAAWAGRRPLRSLVTRLTDAPQLLPRDLALVFLVALLLRLGWIWAYPDPPLNRLGDEIEYLVRSRHLAEGAESFWRHDGWHRWQSWTRAPSYYLLLAALDVTTQTRLRLFVTQAVLGAIGCAAVAVAAGRLAPRSRLAGLLAGLSLAVYLEPINTTTWVMSEALMLAITGVSLAALAALMGRTTAARALVAGLTLGASALVRSTAVPYIQLLTLVLALQPGPARMRLRSIGALVLGATLLIAPWAFRSSKLAGHPVLVDTVTTANLLQYHPGLGFVDTSGLDLDDPGDAKELYRRIQRANEDGLLAARHSEILGAVVRSKLDDPVGTLHRTLGNLGTFFAPFDSWYLEQLAPEGRFVRLHLLTDAMNLVYLWTVGCGALGAALALRDRRGWFLLLWIALVTGAVCVLLQPDFIPGRYRLPIMPALAILAGWWWGRRPLAPTAATTPPLTAE